MSTRTTLPVAAALALLVGLLAWRQLAPSGNAAAAIPAPASPAATSTAPSEALLSPPQSAPLVGEGRSAATVDEEALAARLAEAREERAERGYRLTGRVQSTDGAPVRSFTLVLRATEDDGDEHTFDCEAPDGRFDIETAPVGLWDVFARAEGYQSGDAARVQIPPEPHDVQLWLAPTVELSGRVVDPSGRGVARARIDALGQDEAEAPCFSADDGSFLFPGKANEALSLVASHDEYAPSEAVIVESASVSSKEPIELKLRDGALITGEVFNADAAPDAGVDVDLIRFGGKSFETESDERGLFRFERVPPATYLLFAEAVSRSNGAEHMRLESLTVEDGESYHVILGGAVTEPILVRGQLLSGGQPAKNRGNVVVFREGEQLLASARQLDLDDAARFEVRLDGPGPHVFLVGDDVSFPVDIPDRPEFEVRLDLPTGGLRGRVVDGSGSAVGTRVWLVREDLWSPWRLDSPESDQTDDDGAFSFEGLAAGTYSLHSDATMPRESIRVETGQVVAGVTLFAGAAARVEGRVLDPSGRPVAGADLFASTRDGRWMNRFATEHSDVAGRFSMRLPAGDYLLHARTDDFVSAEGTPVHASQKRPARVDVHVVGGAWLHVRVQSEEGPSAATIELRGGGGARPGQMSSSRDFQTFLRHGYAANERFFGPLAPGSYVVEATANGARGDERITLTGGERRELELTLRKSDVPR